MNQQSGIPANGAHPPSHDPSRALNTLPEERASTTSFDPPISFASDADDEGFDWHRLLAVVKRRKKVIGLTIACVLFVAGIYLALSPKIYTASADLLINAEQKQGSQSANSLPAIAELLDATGTRSQDTEVEILRSGSVQKAAAALLPESMRPALKKSVQVNIAPKRSTDIITVTAQSRDPRLAIAYSNAICQAYRLQNQQNNTAQYRKTATYVGDQLAAVRRKLDQKRAELRRFKEASGIVDLPTESQARVARLNELQSALQQVEGDRASNEAQLKTLRAQAAQMAPAEIVPSTIVARPVVQQLKQQLTALETQRAATFQEFMPGTSEVQDLDDQIAALRRRLKTEAATEVGTYTRNINPVRQAVMQSISQTLAGVWAAQARSEGLRKNIASARQAVEQLPQREFRLSQLQGDLATYQQTFQSLSDKYQTLLISQETPLSNARVVTPAEEAQQVSPRASRTVIMALLGGMFLAMAIALAVDSLDNKIYTEEDAVQVTGLPVLTHVPFMPHQGNRQLLANKADSVMLLESFRMLRTQLAFMASYGHLKTLVLTSSQPGEGKSTVSANLAIALALNGKRVVLLDADLRRPTVHKLFEIDKDPGFTSVVAGLCSLEAALQETGIEGLQVLPSGPTSPNPSELLDSRAARDVIDQVKLRVDYLIIDAPPALMLADAQIVSTVADGVLLVVSCQEARRSGVERTCQLMAQTGIKVVGMVLNKFTQEHGGYYADYGYKYANYSAYLESTEESKA